MWFFILLFFCVVFCIVLSCIFVVDFVLARLLDLLHTRTVCAHQAAVSFFLYLHFLTNKFINSLSPLNFSKREVRKTSWFIRLTQSRSDWFVRSFIHACYDEFYLSQSYWLLVFLTRVYVVSTYDHVHDSDPVRGLPRDHDWCWRLGSCVDSCCYASVQ